MRTYHKICISRLTRISLFFVVLCVSESEAAKNMLSLPEMSVNKLDTRSFGVALHNTHLVTAAQICFTYDSMMGFHITDASLTPRTTGYEPPDAQIDSSDPRNVKVQVVLYSLHGAAIIPGNGDILTFHYQTLSDVFGRSRLLFTKANTILSDIKLNSLPLSVINGWVEYKEPAPVIPREFTNPYIVPEPSTVSLLSIGLLGLVVLMRKKNLSGCK